MKKKAKQKPTVTHAQAAAADVIEWESLGETIDALASMGLVRIVEDNDSGETLVVPVPERLIAASEVDAESQSEEDRLLIEHMTLPPRIEKLLGSEAFAILEAFKRFGLPQLIEPLARRRVGKRPDRIEAGVIAVVSEFLEGAVLAGFSFALRRYQAQLKAVPELREWHEKRDAAGAKGRATQTNTATSRAARAQSMLNSGMEVAAIAKELRCSVPTVYRYLNTAPKPSKPRDRSPKA